jgi:hypothetical protein
VVKEDIHSLSAKLIEMISETVKEKGNLFTYYPKQRTNSIL